MKACTACGETFPLDSFGTNRALKDGRQSKCKGCISAQKAALKASYQLNSAPAEKTCRQCMRILPASAFNANSSSPDKLQGLCKACQGDTHRLAKYGLSPATYANLLAQQGGGCAICQAPACSSGRAFAVDHDHSCCPGKKTCGKCVRALLCWRCNHTLGVLREDVEIFRKAIQYIERTQS
ncbi:endonuclease VII domain-containing protein [Nonomuraea sp. NPDC050404]|uniref:endonuclease VII domain-containing protein n=1 Tax=Nonomuraea sp. NPDC050404 TaxID=3155783 RepID=UPI0033D9EF68